MLNVLFVGDIIGKIGSSAFVRGLSKIKSEKIIDVVIVNGENAGENNGIDKEGAEFLFSAGADVITTGNHVFKNSNFYSELDSNDYILRPLNYSKKAPGHGDAIIDLGKTSLVIANIAGRAFMDPADDPFYACDELLNKYSGYKNIIIDFHAEATGEKAALGLYLNGKVSAVLGTHTHVQTADEKILSGGTAFITDTGMTGPINSILGVRAEDILKKFTTGLPTRFNHADGICQFCAVLLTIDEKTGKTTQIERINNSNI